MLVHCWLHDVPGILHCDLSPNNIMCHWIEEMDVEGKPKKKVYRVLTNYDLLSWTAQLKKDSTGSSQYWTGTPPFMVLDLFDGLSPTHLYRHDIESPFYVMLLMCCCDTFSLVESKTEEPLQLAMQQTTNLPYQHWFDEHSYETLGNCKSAFFSAFQAIKLPSTYKDFYPWLSGLQFQFSGRFQAKNAYIYEQKMVRRGKSSASRVCHKYNCLPQKYHTFARKFMT